MASALNWFEIPVSDMDRAVTFYSTILDIKLEASSAMPGYQMAMFPAEEGTGGALLHGEGYMPSQSGTLVYLACGPDLSVALGKVAAAGGKVLQPKTDIGENGFMAYFLDSEGNKVALHSMG
ncbi:MAG: glyoxalase [Anaerolineaceae bacterium]|nr:glyoxalase [Anaerolineaceae bacterium]